VVEAPWLEPPPGLVARFADLDWALVYQYPRHSVVYRLCGGTHGPFFLKLAVADDYPSLAGEAERTRWAGRYLPVPEVIDQGTEGSVAWLASSPLQGQEGTHPDQLADPSRLTRILARGLRRFHDSAPVGACPFEFRLDSALTHVRSRLEAGLIDPGRDFHPEFAHLTAEAAVELLESTRPEAEDLVVCHGDYCPPNIFIEREEATAYLDLGELGVADRWWDLAAATWSITWNLGPGYEEAFLAEYGVERDVGRTSFYRLMYDLVC
jgi:kanamycin kinase